MKQLKKVILLLAVSLFALPASAQRNKYKYNYTSYLKPQPSAWSMEYRDSSLNGKTLVLVDVTDRKGEGAYNIDFQFTGKEKKAEVYVDTDGNATVLLDSGLYMITCFSIDYSPITPLEVLLSPDKICLFHLRAGASNNFRIAEIYSKRKLTPEEVEALNNAYSTGHGEEHQLIRDKICYVMWQI
jgi:hypothetical protein